MKRRQTSVVEIGNTPLGGAFPIRIQSMADVSTMDTDAAVNQAIKMAAAGAEYIRFTAQGEREAHNLGVIKRKLIAMGWSVDYTDEEYAGELAKIRARFVPFLHLCRKYHTAIRIGVNHGSLSERIMSRYGDTPEGMVASCMLHAWSSCICARKSISTMSLFPSKHPILL